MRAAHQQQRQPCKFGRSCKYLPTNNCHFYHPPQDYASLTRQDYINTSHQHQRHRSVSKGKPHNYNPQHAYFPQGQTKHINSSMATRPKDDPSRMLCKNFHLGIACKQEKCDRLHQFLYKSADSLRRLQFRRDIPQHLSSKLTKIICEEKEVFALQQGNQVVFFKYTFQNNQLTSLGGGINLPENYIYYDQKGKFIYYVTENEVTKFYDMVIFNIQTQEVVSIANSHTSKVTGIDHWDEQTLVSSSLAGDIKIWAKTEEGFVFNKSASEQLTNNYNPQRLPLEILFLQVCLFNQARIISAGTNEARLMFWSGAAFDYMEIPLDKRYAKVYKARLLQVEGIPTAAVLVWNVECTLSAVLLLNLQNGGVSVLREVDSREKIKKNLNLLQCSDEYIFVGSLRGEVFLYNLRVSDKKVGTILHAGMVGDLICSHVETQATGVQVRLLYVLELRSQQNEGSFGIYLLQ